MIWGETALTTVQMTLGFMSCSLPVAMLCILPLITLLSMRLPILIQPQYLIHSCGYIASTNCHYNDNMTGRTVYCVYV